jgi:hypothetical protein
MIYEGFGAENGSLVLSAYEPIDSTLVFNQIGDNPDRGFIGDIEFFTQKFVIEGATLGHRPRSLLCRFQSQTVSNNQPLSEPRAQEWRHGWVES